jgi:WhiB family transcriptional regulator, redox-sensing transcriptional regulator
MMTEDEAPDWRVQAACRGLDPELFFPITTLGKALPQVARAKRVCLRCPVRLACLDWALHTGQDAGIWGGLTDQERRRLRYRELQPDLPADAV